ncbi:MAG: hypothetical protein ABSH26_17675 [Opitutaceae bacterium]|jgi:hypothetical protein
MKKLSLLLAIGLSALVCRSEAAIRWSLEYSYGPHHALAIITTGDFDSSIGGYPYSVGWIPESPGGGYPIISIVGERDGVPIEGLQHGYADEDIGYQPFDATTNPWGGLPRYVLADSPTGLVDTYSTTAFALFDNVIVNNNIGVDYFGLCFTAGGKEYNLFSDGVSVWELDTENVMSTNDDGELVTHFKITRLPNL